jgi:hypothetical protein
VNKRRSNRPDRRLVEAGTYSEAQLTELVRSVRCGGSANHKLRPGDYGFVPPSNPRPHKSPCDDIRPVLRAEATRLLISGIRAEMVSSFAEGGAPKYVWSVDSHGEVFEAKTDPPNRACHGYRLGDDETDMRKMILREWKKRCRKL